jgi:hypothetical protein
VWNIVIDAPSNSWIDSILNPKVKIVKGQRIGTHSWLATLQRVEGVLELLDGNYDE